MLNRHPQLLMLGLRIIKSLLHVQHAAARHTRLIQYLDPVRNRFFSNFCVDLGINLFAVLKSHLV